MENKHHRGSSLENENFKYMSKEEKHSAVFGQSAVKGLYRPEFERDNCGFGLIAQMDGVPSHRLLSLSIKALAKLSHRGAVSADGKSGDGCGLLIKLPVEFFKAKAVENDFKVTNSFAVGMLFYGKEDGEYDKLKRIVIQECQAKNLQIAGWRDVPVDYKDLGKHAEQTCPNIVQVFVNNADDLDNQSFERALFAVRKKVEQQIIDDKHAYVVSLSSKLIGYKGLMMPKYLASFYQDLSDESLETSLAVFHQRFSTNTFPAWKLAQPFRMIAHNGEINTITGNRAWSKAREYVLNSSLIPDLEELSPLVSTKGSDSQSLDNMLEVMVAGGMDLFHAMKILIPSAWQNVETMSQDLRAFYRLYASHMEPWDGPAGIVLSDGRYAACALDRNGLRPARYTITKNREVILASETGVVELAAEEIENKGRLRPGDMLAVDTQTGELLLPSDIDAKLASGKPYKEWLKRHRKLLVTKLAEDDTVFTELDSKKIRTYQKLFNLTSEEKEHILSALSQGGAEAVSSMGDDTPIAVLSQQQRSFYDYFRQQFAQVTNPPIDPLREQIVMSLETSFSRIRNLFEISPAHASRIVVDSPVLSSEKFNRLMSVEDTQFQSKKLSLHYDKNKPLKQALVELGERAIEIAKSGVLILVLSDNDIEQEKFTIPALCATSYIHHTLINAKVRCEVSILVETASARDPHHIASLVAYGATAVYPYLAYDTVQQMSIEYDENGVLNGRLIKRRLSNYRKGINKGIYKIMSKMGVATVASYRGSQLYEIVGLSSQVVDMCFPFSFSRIQGADFEDIEQDIKKQHSFAFKAHTNIKAGGLLKFIHGEEYHAYHPDVIKTIHQAVEFNDSDAYQEFTHLVNKRPVATLRDLLSLSANKDPIDISQVEDVEHLMKRFDTAAMSLGALSPEAHEALAIAMNTIGGRSNSGEGGEDPRRYNTNRVSKIKQIASGRFGVTPEYLMNAEVLQIKIAQGAKPGEGGQLPGDKVNKLIARLRYSTPGVALISPPPHHDIYSIEDLAQLIFDLKQINPDALVSVKLVAKEGIGTIAAGVAKAYADMITVSGYDGGTGASPITSVKYAGSPFELGLAETHQVLTMNELREKIRLQADGGMKTGLDVIKAGILGAESFGFGTMPMVALGCKYLRICHLNNCATGVATQNVQLRERHFTGSPDRVINYFRFVAQELRGYMAELGYATFDELIGNTSLLTPNKQESLKQEKIDLSPILYNPSFDAGYPQYCQVSRNEPSDKGELADKMLKEILPAIQSKSGGVFHYQVANTNRSIGAKLSGAIAKIHGNTDMENSPIIINLNGSVGQSFGVWNAGGLHLKLHGDANDYVGKGMAGGKIVITPPQGLHIKTNKTPIMGNTCLYGATGGKLFATGCAGERFAVRNSGAIAVVEGVGDHGCEYMTGGVVTVLGQTGINFGAGMTGGVAFVLDLDRNFVDCYNHELLDIQRLTPENVLSYLDFMKAGIAEYVNETQSRWGQSVLDDFVDLIGKFWLVKPKATDLASLLDALHDAA